MFRMTSPGQGYLEINNLNISDIQKTKDKIHLIKIALSNPNRQVLERILECYPNTNRYIIDNFIKFYNNFFRNMNKKYYVENTQNEPLITFFKRNNKVCFNYKNVDEDDKNFVRTNFKDILCNCEVIVLSEYSHEYFSEQELFPEDWKGNIIING